MEGFQTPRELAVASGWSERRIRDLIAAKELRHIRLRSRFFIPKGALDELIARKMVAPAAGQGERGDSCSRTSALKP